MSSRHPDRYEKMLPLYALGTLDGEELRDLERHLASGCPECATALAVWQADTDVLADLAPPVQLSNATRDRVLGEILETPQESGFGAESEAQAETRLKDRAAGSVTAMPPPAQAAEARPSRGAEPWLSRIAAALFLGALGWSLWTASGVGRERDQLAVELDGVRDEVARLEEELARVEPDLALVATARRILGSPALEQAQLAGLGDAPAASARAYFSAMGGEAIFFVENLPEIAESETYQLWYIADGAPVPAGIFDGPTATVVVPDVPSADAIQLWAVTVEEAGGVESPTLEAMVLTS